jgi:hypothetical protein
MTELSELFPPVRTIDFRGRSFRVGEADIFDLAAIEEACDKELAEISFARLSTQLAAVKIVLRKLQPDISDDEFARLLCLGGPGSDGIAPFIIAVLQAANLIGQPVPDSSSGEPAKNDSGGAPVTTRVRRPAGATGSASPSASPADPSTKSGE